MPRPGHDEAGRGSVHKISRFQIYSILTLAIFLHLTVLDHIEIFGVKPDLIIILVIFFGLFLGRGLGVEFGLVAGLSKDLFALDFFGINAFIFAITGFLAGVLGAKFSRESKRTQILLVISLTVFSMTAHFILVSIFSKWINLGFGEYFTASVLPTSVYTALVSIPIFFKLTKTYNPRGSEEYL